MLSPKKSAPPRGSHSDSDLVAHKLCELGVLRGFVEMRLAVSDIRWQGRIEAAEDTSEVATFDPCPWAHARNWKVRDRNVTGLDIDEQGRCEHLGRQGTQE